MNPEGLFPIPGYPSYFADKQGRIWSERLPGYLSQMKDRDGYPTVTVRCPDGERRQRFAHCLVALTFHGPRPTPKHHCRHLNGVKTDNRPENLCWGTPKENGSDKVRLGEAAIGSAHGNAKLTELDVSLIKAMLKKGAQQTQMSAIFGVTPQCIFAISKGMTWNHTDAFDGKEDPLPKRQNSSFQSFSIPGGGQSSYRGHLPP